MNAADAKSSTYIDFNAENNAKDPELEFGDHVRISKYKSIFCKRLHSKLF